MKQIQKQAASEDNDRSCTVEEQSMTALMEDPAEACAEQGESDQDSPPRLKPSRSSSLLKKGCCPARRQAKHPPETARQRLPAPPSSHRPARSQ
ncbi:hypothetical protein ACFTAO_46390 [Paenibacillus rhizoplanae]